MKARIDDETKIDITKNSKIPTSIISHAKQLLNHENGKQHLDLASDLVRSIGLLAKTSFDKDIGIDNIYIKSFIPLIGPLFKIGMAHIDGVGQNLIINLIKTIGILTNQASINPIAQSSFAFYKEMVEQKLLSEMIVILKKMDTVQPIQIYLVKVLAVFMHPINGDMFTFPWKRGPNETINEFSESLTLFECLKQAITNSLCEFDWISALEKVYKAEDDSNNNLTKISVLRVLLQCLRVSKELSEKVFGNKTLISLLQYNIFTEDHVICATAMQIFSHILKYAKKDSTIDVGVNTTYVLELFEKNVQNDPVVSVMALNLLAELLAVDTSSSIIIMQKADNISFFKAINELITVTYKKGINRMEEMRKIEGSGYGCPLIAFFDGIFIFL